MCSVWCTYSRCTWKFKTSTLERRAERYCAISWLGHVTKPCKTWGKAQAESINDTTTQIHWFWGVCHRVSILPYQTCLFKYLYTSTTYTSLQLGISKWDNCSNCWCGAERVVLPYSLRADQVSKDDPANNPTRTHFVCILGCHFSNSRLFS